MELSIGTAQNIKSTYWKNEIVEWQKFAASLRNPIRTPETMLEYQHMNKEDKNKIKNGAAFVGGVIKDGRRKKENIVSRSMLVLDADTADRFLEKRFSSLGFEGVMYSTHSYTTEKPKYRIVIPLKSEVDIYSYEALINFFAFTLGLDCFDKTCVEPHRAMYYPSCSIDAKYYYDWVKGRIFDPILFLEENPEWMQPVKWLLSSNQITSQAVKQADPLLKSGIIGAFCSVYHPINIAIDEFLGEVYEQSGDRYTFINGTAPSGLIIYEDKFAFAFNSTDIANDGHLHNAYDIVRIHLFGVDKASQRKMDDFAISLEEVKQELGVQKLKDAQGVFDGKAEWLKELKYNRRGHIDKTISNVEMVLRNDENLKGKIRFNELSARRWGDSDLPWRDGNERFWEEFDNSNLRAYLELYGLSRSKDIIKDGMLNVMDTNRFNPVVDYLCRLKWDGESRVDRMLIDYMGALDTEYTRMVTKTWMTGAVARAMSPGIQFDNMLILVGAQGIGKSAFLRTLIGEDWFTESLTKLDGSKEAAEGLNGKWLVNIDELSALKKKGVRQEQIKNFVTRTVDSYRGAFKEELADNKRRCVFSGTTNEDDFLDDYTGARRYWPVRVFRKPIEVWNGSLNRDQLWAEAYHLWKNKTPIYLEESITRPTQEEFTSRSDQVAMYDAFIMKPIPIDFYSRSESERNLWFQSDIPVEVETTQRKTIAAIEIWTEFMGCSKSLAKRSDTQEISKILKRSKLVGKKTRRDDIVYGNTQSYKINCA